MLGLSQMQASRLSITHGSQNEAQKSNIEITQVNSPTHNASRDQTPDAMQNESAVSFTSAKRAIRLGTSGPAMRSTMTPRSNIEHGDP